MLHAVNDLASQSVLPSQHAIGWGDHWMRADGDLLIFGRVEMLHEDIRACFAAGGSEDECLAETKQLLDSYERGFRYGRCYSVVVPTGELGSTHVSHMVPLTAEQFEEARQDGWLLENVSQRPWFLERALAIVAEAQQHGI